MIRVFASLGLLLALGSVARADGETIESITSFDPDQAVAPQSTVEGAGIKIGEGTVLHPVLGVETGFISNVFYTDTNPTAAGVLRLMGQIGAGSLTGARVNSVDDDANREDLGDFQYRASLGAAYDFMLSGDETVRATGGLSVNALVRGIVKPASKISLGFDENFLRLIRAANYETNTNTNRDINNLMLTLLYHPQEAALSGWLYYNNTIDVFEDNANSFADRLQHRFGLHAQYKIFPQTTALADVSIGVYNGLGTGSDKVSSYPLTALAGISTLLSLKTTFNLQAGYANGFYSSGPSYSAPTIGASIGYRYSPLGRATLTYDWMYQDSVNANYYRDHVVRLWVQQMIKPFVFEVQPELHFREYSGVNTVLPGAAPTRDDVIFALIAGVHYNFRNWIAATLDYRFTDDNTDYRYTTADGSMDNPGYVRHELLLGVRVAY